jgi:hypothetical protein
MIPNLKRVIFQSRFIVVVTGLLLFSFQNCSKTNGFRTISSSSLTALAEPGTGPSMPEEHLNVVLAWNKVDHTQLAGYRLYYGSSEGVYEKMIDVGLTENPNAPEFNLPPLDPRLVYFFTVRAYTSTGIESAASESIIVTGL